MNDRGRVVAERRASFSTRRVAALVARQLTQGVTPERLALTIALGLVIGVFPVLGATTVLCGIAAAALGLNQPVIQLANYVAYPAQLVGLIPFYRAGETLFHRPHLPLSIPLLVERFRGNTGKFFADFGVIAVDGIVVWCLVAPFVAAAVYYLLRPSLRRLARRARDRRAE